MDPGRRIPAVTRQDLIEFNVAKFGSRSRGGRVLHTWSDYPIEDEGPAELGLGSYADDTPRTLTDDEITYFRESEIRKLLLLRSLSIDPEETATQTRVKVDHNHEDSLSEGEIDPGDDAMLLDALSNCDESTNETGKSNGEKTECGSQSAPTSITVQNHALCAEKENYEPIEKSGTDDDDESAYAEFLAEERREFMKATQQDRAMRQRGDDHDDRRISTRRRIREMDASNDVTQILSYGDENDLSEDMKDKQISVPGDNEPQEYQKHGRRIWWPQLGTQHEEDLFVDA